MHAVPITVFALVQVAIGIASHNLGEGTGQVLTGIALAIYVVVLALRVRWFALPMLIAPPVVGLLAREIGLEYNWRAAAVIATTVAIAVVLDLRERGDESDGSDTVLDVV